MHPSTDQPLLIFLAFRVPPTSTQPPAPLVPESEEFPGPDPAPDPRLLYTLAHQSRFPLYLAPLLFFFFPVAVSSLS